MHKPDRSTVTAEQEALIHAVTDAGNADPTFRRRLALTMIANEDGVSVTDIRGTVHIVATIHENGAHHLTHMHTPGYTIPASLACWEEEEHDNG